MRRWREYDFFRALALVIVAPRLRGRGEDFFFIFFTCLRKFDFISSQCCVGELAAPSRQARLAATRAQAVPLHALASWGL